jgi:spermidine dehydrogenase
MQDAADVLIAPPARHHHTSPRVNAMRRKRSDNDDESLGMHQRITRKDFLNTTLLGVGAALLKSPSPSTLLSAASRESNALVSDPWTGYAGVGDYARANGNTFPVLSAAHKIRDGAYTRLPATTTDTGEIYDLVVVGGGISGLTAAYYFNKASGGSKKILVLENHPIFGGEARQNEFLVRGQRLIGPQGSNQGNVPRAGSGTAIDEIWTDLGLAREVKYQEWDAALKPLRFQLDNYAHMEGVDESLVDIGYYFDERSGTATPTWLRNIWANDLVEAPFSPEVKRDLLKWRYSSGENTDQFRRKLDTMTYKDYIERELGLRPEVTKMAEPVVGLINGASPDAVSAFAASQIGMPGVSARVRGKGGSLPQSFPGGNSTYARCFVRALIPDAIPTGTSFDGIIDGSIDFSALDRPRQPTRIRLGAVAVRVEHVARAGSPDLVRIAYEQGGQVRTVSAKKVVVATGGWITKHVVADLPEEIKTAYNDFHYAPAMVVNVALTNWRFLYKLGAPAVRWFGDGFGFSANIRRSMVTSSYVPPLHPDKPTILTYYLGLYTPGRSAYEQGVMGRAKLLASPYADYERQIREHMTRLFSDAGFDPRTDIAGIILNRWGHARVVQPPGWHYGTEGKPAPRDVVMKGYGNVAIGHSELNGHQSAGGAMQQGKRAAEQVLGTAS